VNAGGGSDRFLVVNADDFGLSEGVNRGIIQAHEHGIVTSASLMVRWPAAAEAAAYAKRRGALGVGLHVDMGEWVYRDGEWRALYEVVRLDDAAAVWAELERQLETFRRLVGRDPTHLDSHQHVHRDDPLRSMLSTMAEKMSVPLRHVIGKVRYVGDFYAQDNHGRSWPELIGTDSLIRILKALPPGVSELCCHPGFAGGLETSYTREREQEVQTLCDPRVIEAANDLGLKLCSFEGVSRDAAGESGRDANGR
jgi:predicted glycoside hydrolase/deacetylase ChbG (UPF0249 family)